MLEIEGLFLPEHNEDKHISLLTSSLAEATDFFLQDDVFTNGSGNLKAEHFPLSPDSLPLSPISYTNHNNRNNNVDSFMEGSQLNTTTNNNQNHIEPDNQSFFSSPGYTPPLSPSNEHQQQQQLNIQQQLQQQQRQLQLLQQQQQQNQQNQTLQFTDFSMLGGVPNTFNGSANLFNSMDMNNQNLNLLNGAQNMQPLNLPTPRNSLAGSVMQPPTRFQPQSSISPQPQPQIRQQPLSQPKKTGRLKAQSTSPPPQDVNKIAIQRLTTATSRVSTVPTESERKNSHNRIERRYRDKINGHLGDLRDMLPPSEGKRMNKAGIMKRAVEYITYLQNRNEGLMKENLKCKDIFEKHGLGGLVNFDDTLYVDQMVPSTSDNSDDGNKNQVEMKNKSNNNSTQINYNQIIDDNFNNDSQALNNSNNNQKVKREPSYENSTPTRLAIFFIVSFSFFFNPIASFSSTLSSSSSHSSLAAGRSLSFFSPLSSSASSSPLLDDNSQYFLHSLYMNIAWLSLRSLIQLACFAWVLSMEPVTDCRSSLWNSAINSRKKAINAIDSNSMSFATQHISDSLLSLSRPLPTSFNLYFSLAWEFFHQITHLLYFGLWIERIFATRSSDSMKSYKIASDLYHRLHLLCLHDCDRSSTFREKCLSLYAGLRAINLAGPVKYCTENTYEVVNSRSRSSSNSSFQGRHSRANSLGNNCNDIIKEYQMTITAASTSTDRNIAISVLYLSFALHMRVIAHFLQLPVFSFIFRGISRLYTHLAKKEYNQRQLLGHHQGVDRINNQVNFESSFLDSQNDFESMAHKWIFQDSGNQYFHSSLWIDKFVNLSGPSGKIFEHPLSQLSTLYRKNQLQLSLAALYDGSSSSSRLLDMFNLLFASAHLAADTQSKNWALVGQCVVYLRLNDLGKAKDCLRSLNVRSDEKLLQSACGILTARIEYFQDGNFNLIEEHATRESAFLKLIDLSGELLVASLIENDASETLVKHQRLIVCDALLSTRFELWERLIENQCIDAADSSDNGMAFQFMNATTRDLRILNNLNDIPVVFAMGHRFTSYQRRLMNGSMLRTLCLLEKSLKFCRENKLEIEEAYAMMELCALQCKSGIPQEQVARIMYAARILQKAQCFRDVKTCQSMLAQVADRKKL